MNLFLLDTDTISLFQHGNAEVLRHRRDHPIDLIAVSIITVEEQLNGWYTLLRKPQSPETTAALYQRMTATLIFLGALPIVTFSEAAIYRFESLKAMRLNVGLNDLRIAAIALEENAVLVIRNRRDFERVPNLLLEDWSQ